MATYGQIILTVMNIAIRIGGLFQVAYWGCDCFFREFKIWISCEKFELYPNPEYFTVAWLFIVILTSLFLIYRLGIWPGWKSLRRLFCTEKYVVDLVCTLIFVLVYDVRNIVEVRNKEGKTTLYTFFMFEHLSSVVLVITLEYFPESVNKKITYRRYMYRAILLVYALEHFVLFVLATMATTYTLVSIPTCTDKELENNSYYNTSVLAWLLTAQGKPTTNSAEPCHEAKTVTMVLLLMVLASLRYQLKEFFLSKFFETHTQENTNEKCDRKSKKNFKNPNPNAESSSLISSVKMTYNALDAEDKQESTMEQKM